MGKFNFDSLKKAAAPLIAERVTSLRNPKSSEYYYLTTLSERDVSFDVNYVRIITPKVEYKVEGHYVSRLDVNDKERKVSYTSTFSVDPFDGVMVSKSQHYQNIPAGHLQRVTNYINGHVLTAADIKNKIIEDARSKVRAKVRRSKDPIEDTDISKIEIVEYKVKKTTIMSVEWAEVTRVSDGLKIATAYGSEGSSAHYDFIPAEVAEVYYETEEENVEEPPARSWLSDLFARSEEEERISASEVFSIIKRCIGKMFSAAFVAALIVIFIVNLFGGGIFNASPGIYEITTDNYQNYILIRQPYSNYYVKIEEGESQTHMLRQTSSDMSEYSLYQIVPANASVSLFDRKQKESIRHYSDYKPNFLSRKVRKYVINELYIRYEVTYCYNGTEYTVENEMYFSDFSELKNTYLTADFPQESVKSVTNEYVSNMKGDTYQQTEYWPDVEYWYVNVLEVSGVAEVTEVN